MNSLREQYTEELGTTNTEEQHLKDVLEEQRQDWLRHPNTIDFLNALEKHRSELIVSVCNVAYAGNPVSNSQLVVAETLNKVANYVRFNQIQW